MQKGPHQETSQLAWQRPKTRRKNLESSKRKTLTYKGGPVRPSADFSMETVQDRRDWPEIFKVMESKDLKP